MKFADLAGKYNQNTAGDIIAVKKNNIITGLDETAGPDDDFVFIDTSSLEGIRIYRNTLKFVLVKAVSDLFPGTRLKIHYSVNNGSFCELAGRNVGKEEVNRIRKRMKYIIGRRLPIEKNVYETGHAKKILEHINRTDLLELLSANGSGGIVLYSLEGAFDYFHGILAPDTGYVDLFELRHFQNGFLMFYPTRFNPGALPEWKTQKKLARAFEEIRQWGDAIGVDNISDLNALAQNGGMNGIIRVSEALQEKKIGYIADEIKRKGKSFVFISGPSSSGKTTFAKRLEVHLKAVGLKAHPISLDDYYKGGNIPLDISGKKDYESPDAFDIERFNGDLHALQVKGRAEIPDYDFATESRKGCRLLEMERNGVVIVEGIHGNNPAFSTGVDRQLIHKLYISALTSVSIDDHNRLSTTDARLFRRLVRDYKYRGASAERTLGMWEDVRRGEDLHIFPFQEEADEIFNSTLIYEHSVLKKYAEPILREVGQDSEYYTLARRLLVILSYFKEADDTEVPGNSLLREFIGGSVFNY